MQSREQLFQQWTGEGGEEYAKWMMNTRIIMKRIITKLRDAVVVTLLIYLVASGIILNFKLLTILADKSNLKAADAAWVKVCDSDDSQSAFDKRDVIGKRLELYCADIPPLSLCEH